LSDPEPLPRGEAQAGNPKLAKAFTRTPKPRERGGDTYETQDWGAIVSHRTTPAISSIIHHRMPWTYHQESGVLEDPEGMTLTSSGYSGSGEGKNNGDAEYLLEGPIPRGTYFVRGAYDSPLVGPVAIPLVPAAANQMFGRSNFRIVGDSPFVPERVESHIVLSYPAREAINASPDKILVVVR
jgi:hypothetical protein